MAQANYVATLIQIVRLVSENRALVVNLVRQHDKRWHSI